MGLKKKTKSQPKQSEILCRVFSSTFQSKPTKSHSTEERGEVHCAGLKPTVPSRLSLQLWNTSVWHRSCREKLPLTGWDRRAEMTLWDLTTGEEQSFHTVCLSLFRAYQSHRLCHTKERFLLSTPKRADSSQRPHSARGPQPGFSWGYSTTASVCSRLQSRWTSAGLRAILRASLAVDPYRCVSHGHSSFN